MRWLAIVVASACGVDHPKPPEDPCAGTTGTFHEQTYDAGDGSQRAFYLHVPASYDCATPAPLLVDFHGTGFDTTDGTPPEEMWATPGLEQASDALGFIVVRPRSQHFTDTDGQVVYHWDSHPGDLERNKADARRLVDALAGRYHIDRARIYASGFSNGTNMVAQFLGEPAPLFAGYGLVGGGIWATYTAPLAGVHARIYDTTGYRDQLRPESLAFYRWLDAQGFATSQLWIRETNAGHELYGWQFEEMFRWLDQGARPASQLAPGWSTDGFTDSRSVLRLAMLGGDVIASGAGGRVWRRRGGAWTELAALLPDRPTLALDGLCTTPGGAIVTTGDHAVGVFANQTWTVDPASGGAPGDDEDRLEALACVSATTVVGGGPSYAATSLNLGASWGPADISVFGTTPSVSAIAQGPSGAWVAAGADYIGRSANGTSFTAVEYPTTATWLYGVSPAGAAWWIAGEAGTVLVSHDDGTTWAPVHVPTREDLYAIRFFDASRGMAVGLHGAAILTTDGGVTWSDVSVGLDAMLSDVAWLDPSTVLVVGGDGTVLRRGVAL